MTLPSPKRSPERDETLPLFQKISLSELVARVQIDAPSVPVRSSERGSGRVKRRLPAQHAKIIAELAKAGCVPESGKYLSRDEIARRAKMRETAACGRLGPSGGLLMPDGRTEGPWPVRRQVDAAVSDAGEKVFGYQLTVWGLGLIRDAGIQLIEAA